MTAKPYLLDTNVLLHLIRGRDLGRYIEATFELENPVYRPLVSIVAHGEIWALAERNAWGPEKRAALEAMLDNLITIDLNDQSILDAYVEMDGACRGAPGGARSLGDNDLWIASTTRAAEAVLLTTDRDFLHLHPDHCFVHYIDPKSRLAGTQEGAQADLE
jgi:tRNA(fMet)-specific endonuclease VapC